jgi:predicted transcriptional regulator
LVSLCWRTPKANGNADPLDAITTAAMNALELLTRIDSVKASAKQILTLMQFASGSLTVPQFSKKFGTNIRHGQSLINVIYGKGLIEPYDKTEERTKYRITPDGETMLNKILSK